MMWHNNAIKNAINKDTINNVNNKYRSKMKLQLCYNIILNILYCTNIIQTN